MTEILIHKNEFFFKIKLYKFILKVKRDLFYYKKILINLFKKTEKKKLIFHYYESI